MGFLVRAVQEEQTRIMERSDTNEWRAVEEVLKRADELPHICDDRARLSAVLGENSIAAYLGLKWVANHPNVREAVLEAQRLLAARDV